LPFSKLKTFSLYVFKFQLLLTGRRDRWLFLVSLLC